MKLRLHDPCKLGSSSRNALELLEMKKIRIIPYTLVLTKTVVFKSYRYYNDDFPMTMNDETYRKLSDYKTLPAGKVPIWC